MKPLSAKIKFGNDASEIIKFYHDTDVQSVIQQLGSKLQVLSPDSDANDGDAIMLS